MTIERDSGATTVYVCHVELRAADVAAVQKAALEAAQIRRQLGFRDDEYQRIVQLPAHNETAEEQADIAAEFYAEDESNQGDGDYPTSDATARPETRAAIDSGRKPGDIV